jgi:hypothetical protein
MLLSIRPDVLALAIPRQPELFESAPDSRSWQEQNCGANYASCK